VVAADKARQLARQETALQHAQANILAELSAVKLLRSDFDSALRLASRGNRPRVARRYNQNLTGRSRAEIAVLRDHEDTAVRRLQSVRAISRWGKKKEQRDHRGRRYVIPSPQQTDEVFSTHR
jgi:hypothetical protein